MPRPRKTAAQLTKTRELILDTAYAILQAEGPQAITSRAVAERMGVSHMALYTYFKNQAAILSALGERETAKFHAQQQALEKRAEKEDIVQVTGEALKQFISIAQKNPNLYRLAWVTPEIGENSLQKSRQRLRDMVAYLSRLLTIGMDKGRFTRRDPFLAAATAMGMVNLPYILFYTGKLNNPDLRDHMVAEGFSAAMHYLIK